MNLRRLVAAPLILLGISVTPALADTINYSFSGLGTTATFSLPSNPTPSAIGSNYFQINGVSVAISGVGTFTGNIDFFTAAAGGGAGSGADILNGAQLFSGTLADPTLLTGSFALSGTVTPDSDGPIPVSGTLNASAGTAFLAPEPSSLLLLLTGISSLAGAAALRRRSSHCSIHRSIRC